MPKLVQVDGIGGVEFADDFTDADIERQVSKLYLEQEKQQVAAQDKVSRWVSENSWMPEPAGTRGEPQQPEHLSGLDYSQPVDEQGVENVRRFLNESTQNWNAINQPTRRGIALQAERENLLSTPAPAVVMPSATTLSKEPGIAGGGVMGSLLKGLNTLFTSIPMSPGVPQAGLAPQVGEATPEETRKAQQEMPLYKMGEWFQNKAAEIVQSVPEHEQETVAGQMVGMGSSLALLLSQPQAAPIMFGLTKTGEVYDTAYDAELEKGKTKDEAAQTAANKALLSGAKEVAIWELGPKALHSFVGERIARTAGKSASSRWLAQTVSGGTTLGGTAAASTALGNIIEGKPAGENVGTEFVAGFGLARAMHPTGLAPAGTGEIPYAREVNNLLDWMRAQPAPKTGTKPTYRPPGTGGPSYPTAGAPPPPPPAPTPPPAPVRPTPVALPTAHAPQKDPLAEAMAEIERARLQNQQEVAAAEAEIAQRKAESDVRVAGLTPVPETPATLEAQVDLVDAGTKPAMLVTPGAAMPDIPEGFATFDTAQGTVVFDPRRISPEAINHAVETGNLGPLLGLSSQDKPPGASSVLQTRNPAGVPVQEEVVTADTLPAAVEAAAKTVPDGTMAVVPAEQVVSERLPARADMSDAELQAEWWDNSLTSAGRSDKLKAAGVKLPATVKWRHMSPENQQKVDYLRTSEYRPGEAEPAAPKPEDHPMVQAARALMYERFRADQIRGTPEMPDKMTDHIERVAKMVDDPVLRTIAYLHDIVEDTPTTVAELRQRFGDRVADAVEAETWRKDHETYDEYINRLSFNPDAIQTKLADIADNLATSRRWPMTEKLAGKHVMWQEAEARLQARLKADITPTIARPGMPDGSAREPWRNTQIDKVVATANEPPADHAPKVVFSGGGAGAGKSTVVKNEQKPGGSIHDGIKLTISADDFKTGKKSVAVAGAAGIPEYKALVDANDPRAAIVAHKESTTMAKETLARVLGQGRDVIYDATMSDANADWPLAEAALQRGYDIELVAVAIDPKVAFARAKERGKKEGRYIPEDALLAGHAGFTRSFPTYLERFPEVKLWDNNTDRQARLILSKSTTKGIEIIDPEAYIKWAGQTAYEHAKRLQDQGTVETPSAPPGAEGDRPDGDLGGGRGRGPQATGEGGPAPGGSLAGVNLQPAITQLADIIRKEKLNRRTAHDIVAKAYGGTLAGGKFTAKDLSDIIEVAVNRVMLERARPNRMNYSAEAAQAEVRALKELMERLPTQTSRTVESDKMQQFSTPPTEAFVANWVANVKATDVMLEPSAGVGGLTVFSKATGARVVANELSDRRADLLAASGLADYVSRHNAEHLNALLKPAMDNGSVPRPTVVVMNPPFSNAASSNRKATIVGGKHVEEALKMLPPGGRLVAIVGSGMAMDRPTFKGWWDKIKKQYNVRANVQVNGEEYRKYGTSFDNQLVVIDKTGPTPEADAIVAGRAESVEDLIPLLERIRNERPNLGQAERTPVESGGIAPSPGGGAPPVAGGNAPAGLGAPGQPAGGRGAGLSDVETAGGLGGASGVGAGVVGGGPGAGLRGAGEPRPGGRPDVGHPAGGDVGPTGELKTKAEVAAEANKANSVGLSLEQFDKGKRQLSDAGVFTEYEPRKVRIKGAKKHPTPLVESTAMAAVDPVDPVYKPNLPDAIISEGRLSATGIENVVYAGQAHTKTLPNGQRMGYFIGDGTGVGKGRQIVGIIMDNWNQGRRKAVWVSKSINLIEDAKRDFGDMGFDVNKVIDFWKKGGTNLIGKNEGVAFVPYSSLRSNNPGLNQDGVLHPPTLKPAKPAIPAQGGKPAKPAEPAKLDKSRMHLLQDWLGKDFDGVIVFDEAHMAGNAIDVQGNRGVKLASAQGRTVLDVQNLFPHARVVYSSATGATDVTNLSYADRMGIWGPGTPFATKQDFFNQVKAGGLSAMEIVARDLKSMGRYLARTLSFEGVTHRQLVHKLTPDQQNVYDELARAWQYVLGHRNETMARTGAANDGKARSAANSAFYGAQQRFYNQTLTAMQMPSVITDAKAELAKNHSIVMQLVNTDEAAQNRQIARKASEAAEGDNYLEDLDLSPKEILQQYIENSYPTTLYEPVTDENGNTRWQPVRDAVGNPVADPEAVRRKQELQDSIGLLKAPDSPISMVLNTFGVDNVAEITGRSQRVVQRENPKTGNIEPMLEKNRGKAHRKVETEEFNEGKRRVLMFSDAGGTGFSYHASRRVNNQQRRIHYLVQAGWRADQAMQGFGRTHRSDQASAPEYVLPSTDIKGHQRFISTIARRLSELGAITGGERKSAGGEMFSDEANLENQYAEDGVDALFADLHSGNVEGFDFWDVSRKLGFTKTIVNEHTGELKEINTLIGEGGELRTDKIPPIQQFLNRVLSLEMLEQNRLFDAFLERMANRIENAKADGSYDPGTQTLKALAIRKVSDETVYKDPESTAATRLVEIEHDHPQKIMDWDTLQSGQPVLGYARNNRSQRLFALKEGPTKTLENGSIVATYRRYHAGGYDIVPRNEISAQNFTVVDRDAARPQWEAAMAALPKVRTERDTYVVGAFLPVWNRLKIPEPKIWRITPGGEETILGAHVPPRMVPGVRARLGAGMGGGRGPENVFRAVLETGERIELANGWKLKRSRVLGENRIEVEGLQRSDIPEFEDHIGGHMERIDYKPRFFLPTEEVAGLESMDKLLKKAPVAGTVAATETTHEMAETGQNRPLSLPSGAIKTRPGATGEADFGETAPEPAATGETPPEVEHGFSGNTSLVQAAAKDVAGMRNLVAPQTAGGPARFTANTLRELNAKMANEMARADLALRVHRRDFDRTPVPRTWNFDPTLPLPRNYAFIDAYETGNVAGLGRDAAAATELHKLNQADLARVHALGTGALRTFYDTYFPHLWENPRKAAAVFAKILGHAPLEGSKSFLKQRTHQLFVQGLAAGLKPVHDNPIDMWLLKKREIERYILAHSFIKEMKAAGLMQFNYVFKRTPDGWSKVNDSAFTQYGPPTVTIKEAFDAGMREATLDLLKNLGVPHERLTRIGGQRWGYERETPGVPGSERIVTKFAGPDFVIWHELGHVLDNRYKDLEPTMTATDALNTELTALANLRLDATSPASFQRGVHTMSEKMAVVLQAYVHAPKLMEQVAPSVRHAFGQFIKAHPELEPINDIHPGLRLGAATAEMTHGGLLKLGDYIMPDGAAKVVNNYLSPGLNPHLWYRTLRSASNLLNGVQLGLSAFHLGFTSLDAATSRMALALEDAAGLHFGRAVRTALSVPMSPVTNIMTGAKLRAEVLRPGTHPEMAALARALERAGGRVGQDAFWQTEFTRRMQRAWHQGGLQIATLPLRVPLAVWEQSMRPILEYIVPRQKLGVFADLAGRAMLRLGPGAGEAETREAMRKAWDSVDNRMGQVVYDNLFYNRSVKDVALLAFRAYGWQLGKYREVLGAGADVVRAAGNVVTGHPGRAEFTHRMAYTIALPLMVGTIGGMIHYLLTGQKPKGRDYFQPQTGETDRNGNPVRLNLPSYVKDAISYGKHPITSFGHSLNPMMSSMMDLLGNADFYNVQIHNPDDPFWQQGSDVLKFAAKQFVPFSVSGAQQMREDAAPAWKQVGPFFGITPVPVKQTMTPAQELASEIMASGAEVVNRAAFDRKKAIRDAVTQIQRGQTVAALAAVADGLDKHTLNPNTAEQMILRLKYTPLQFQVTHMTPDAGLRVWNIASEAERDELRPILVAKVAGARSLWPEQKVALVLQMLKAPTN